MKRILFLTMIFVCALNMSAQTYLDHVQTRETGKGTVTVHQSKDIDELVNGTNPNVLKVKKTTNAPRSAKKETAAEQDDSIVGTGMANAAGANGAPVTRINKKQTGKVYKVAGYRVQVFAGGNSRQDKTKATAISNQIKAHFPGQPVYCHFYSPRWICRFGNFPTYELAQTYLTRVRALGYSQASIVKGVITVKY